MISKKNLMIASFAILAAPFFSTAAEKTETVAPDNTQVNQRDRSVTEVTSQDQSNTKPDMDLTQKIRQEVVKQKNFSMDAKNIKIISMDGKVTLKGPVKTASEKKKIEGIAARVAGHSNVTSQIEIETK